MTQVINDEYFIECLAGLGTIYAFQTQLFVFFFVLLLYRIPVSTKGLFSDLMTMRRSPRRPLILKRRKLPFQQNDAPAAQSQSQFGAPGSKEPSKSAASQCFPDGIRIMNHPSMPDTQVVVIPKAADLQSVIGALTAKGKECGVQGPNKFILLSENGSCDNRSFCQTPAEGDDLSTKSTDGQPVKAEIMHDSPDAKPLTGIKPCKEMRFFSKMIFQVKVWSLYGLLFLFNSTDLVSSL